MQYKKIDNLHFFLDIDILICYISTVKINKELKTRGK